MKEYGSLGVVLPSDVVPYHEIHDAFAVSAHGERLGRCVRYDSYRPGHVSHEAWESLLGVDVNNLQHMSLVEHMTGGFVRASRARVENGERVDARAIFSPDDEGLLRLAAIIHDWGESVVGDITYRKKSAEHERLEHMALSDLIAGQASEHGMSAPDSRVLAERMQHARIHILKDSSSRLGMAFNAIERTGYMRTAMRAWDVCDYVSDDVVRDSLQWITTDVLAGSTRTLLEYSEIYPHTQIYMEMYRSRIQDAFSKMPDSIFDMYEIENRDVQRDKFNSSREMFHATEVIAV